MNKIINAIFKFFILYGYIIAGAILLGYIGLHIYALAIYSNTHIYELPNWAYWILY